MKIIEIKRSDFKKKSIEQHWTKHAVKTIDEIIKTWLDTSYACSVLLFFRDDNDLHAYMPIITGNEERFVQSDTLQGDIGKPTIIGVEPYLINGCLNSSDVETIYKIMFYQYYWDKNEAFLMSDKEQILEIDTKKPTSFESIKYARDRIQFYRSKVGKTPTTLVRAVEAMQREYDEISGFAQCQIESHSFAIKLEGTKNKGKFLVEDLIRFAENHFNLFNIANPSESKQYTLNYVAFVPGSSCLVGDFDIIPDQEEKVDKAEIKETIAKAEQKMSKIVEAAPVLVDKSKTPAERVKQFKNATGLSNEEAYAAMHGLSKMRTSHQTVKLHSSKIDNENEDVIMTIDGTASTQISEIKRALAEIIDPDKTRTLKGKIVELDHYKDDDLKFGVYAEDEKHLYIVHYPKVEDQKVREKKGENVTVVVWRDGHNKPWHFQEWK